MIFVTVGVQLPFDRLVSAVDRWAGDRGCTDVFAQIGPSHYRPQHLAFRANLGPIEFRERVKQADWIVAHAGMGSIITALELGKPILIMPRRADLQEHRNDHQLSTARQLLDKGIVDVARDEGELVRKLDVLAEAAATPPISPHASMELISTISAFIRNATGR